MAPSGKQPDGCPIDHTARSKWLEQARQASEDHSSPSPPPSTSSAVPTASVTSPPDAPRILKTRPLALDREISSIPRTDPNAPNLTPNTSTSASPSTSNVTVARSSNISASHSPNAEGSASRDAQSGNWIYPSEKMFFDAMRRKNHDPRATDMASIVPIHNAVNERAWKEIKDWEKRFGWARQANSRCGGPKLHSFSGDSQKLTPKARINGLLGYQAPFDRHDWVVERCHGEPMVEYVIDFYAGRDDGKGRGLSFYLDVRPKLNSWEGWRMRAARMLGW